MPGALSDALPEPPVNRTSLILTPIQRICTQETSPGKLVMERRDRLPASWQTAPADPRRPWVRGSESSPFRYSQGLRPTEHHPRPSGQPTTVNVYSKLIWLLRTENPDTHKVPDERCDDSPHQPTFWRERDNARVSATLDRRWGSGGGPGVERIRPRCFR